MLFNPIAPELWLLLQLKIAIDCVLMGKLKKQPPFIAISLQIFWQTFSEMFHEKPSTRHIILRKLLNLIGCPGKNA